MKYIKSIKDLKIRLINIIKCPDCVISTIMKNGIKFSFVLSLFATYILLTYISISSPDLFYIGISLFRASLMFGVTFFICGIGFNTIKQEIS